MPVMHGLEAHATVLRGWGREFEGGGRGLRPLAPSHKMPLSLTRRLDPAGREVPRGLHGRGARLHDAVHDILRSGRSPCHKYAFLIGQGGGQLGFNRFDELVAA